MTSRLTRKDVELDKKQPLYEGFLSVYKYKLKHRLFQGGWSQPIERELMERGHAVVVIPYDPVRDELVVLEQFRVGALDDPNGPWLFEFVAGMFDADESAEEVATRELKEEAGLEAKQLIYATSYYSSPGGTDETLTIYIAEVDSSLAADFGGLEGRRMRTLKCTCCQDRKSSACWSARKLIMRQALLGYNGCYYTVIAYSKIS